jgi:type III pantothenate kinase
LRVADIGNTNVKLWEDGKISRVRIEEFRPSGKAFYISVNRKFVEIEDWVNLEEFVKVNTIYKGLGVDRKVAILGESNRIVVDMGSAITVDIVKDGLHIGGYILLGKKSIVEKFRENIPHLQFGKEKFGDEVPQNTEDALYFGYLHPIVSLLQKLQKEFQLPILVTGGDYEDLKKFFPEAQFSPNLIFEKIFKLLPELSRIEE